MLLALGCRGGQPVPDLLGTEQGKVMVLCTVKIAKNKGLHFFHSLAGCAMTL